MAITLLETRDHSHTLYVPELDETYHSRNGAIEEALYVYIGRGLNDWFRSRALGLSSFGSAQDDTSAKQITYETENSKPQTANSKPQTVHLLEMGFGTGLNAWLTALECATLDIHCHYHSLETFPLGKEVISQLNYTSEHSIADVQVFSTIHKSAWNTPVKITEHFTLHKELVSLQDFVAGTGFDIIYFDAFAPEKQPELWTEDIFRKLYASLNPGGAIVTYSSKGDIRRMWQAIGFEVERLKGPPFKRHMLRGRKN